MTSKWTDQTATTTLADTDITLVVTDTTTTPTSKKITWANIKSALTSVFAPYVAPGTSGNVLTSNGSAWTSAAASGSGDVLGIQVFS